MSQSPEAVRCARHPGVETYLRCSRCETPICPSCLIQTPVGARCRSCAGLRKLPTYQANPNTLARTALAALLVGLLGAVIMDFIRGFDFILTILLGLLAPEAVGRANNGRRGPIIGWTAAAAIVVGMVLGRGAFVLLTLSALPIVARFQVALMAMASINIIGWLMIIVVAAIVYYRLRV